MIDLPKPRKTADKHPAPPINIKTPKKSPKPDNVQFNFYWDLLIESVMDRPNFKTPHLLNLKVLCDLYCDYDEACEIISIHGSTYEVDEGRNGPQIKNRPEVAQINRLRVDIANYSKLLGLVLFKDSKTGNKDDEDDWK